MTKIQSKDKMIPVNVRKALDKKLSNTQSNNSLENDPPKNDEATPRINKLEERVSTLEGYLSKIVEILSKMQTQNQPQGNSRSEAYVEKRSLVIPMFKASVTVEDIHRVVASPTINYWYGIARQVGFKGSFVDFLEWSVNDAMIARGYIPALIVPRSKAKHFEPLTGEEVVRGGTGTEEEG